MLNFDGDVDEMQTQTSSVNTPLNTDGLEFLKNSAIWGDSQECIIFVKFQYPQVLNSFKDF